MRNLIFILFLLSECLSAFAAEPDILVTQKGESIMVYNLDITSGDKIYYTVEDGEEAPVMKIPKSDVLIIKKADGLKIDFATEITNTHNSESILKDNEAASNFHEYLTTESIEPDFVDYVRPEYKKNGWGNIVDGPSKVEKSIKVNDGIGNMLTMRLLSKADKTLAVTKPRDAEIQKKKKVKKERRCYTETTYFIPDYVKIGDDTYAVVQIDKYAFGECYANEIIFPKKLKVIDDYAFYYAHLRNIILPEGLEKIGTLAFASPGSEIAKKSDFTELYIPKSVKAIGQGAFVGLCRYQSPRGFYQGYLGCIPNWITPDNCDYYGIDDNAVEDYQERKRGN